MKPEELITVTDRIHDAPKTDPWRPPIRSVAIVPAPSSIDQDDTGVAAKTVASLGMKPMISKAVRINNERQRLFNIAHLGLV
jgi:hypothetical protein